MTISDTKSNSIVGMTLPMNFKKIRIELSAWILDLSAPPSIIY